MTVNKDIIKNLIQCQESPCISIYMSTKAVHRGEFKKLSIEFKNLLQEAEKKLEDNWDFKQHEVDEFLESAYNLASDSNFWQQQKEGLAVFITENRFEHYKLGIDVYDKVYVSYSFNLKQLIAELKDDQKYYLLTVSPNYNQLYEADRNNIEKIELKKLPVNIKEFLNLDDEAAEKYQSINTAGGSSVFHGQGGASDDDNEDLMHYLKEIDKVINKKLKDSESYLVVAADDNVFSMYKNLNNYDKLLEENVSGNAKQMNKKELRKKSWEIVNSHLHDYLDKDKERFLELQAGDKTGDKLEEIVEAAHFGKIDTLFLNKSSEKSGIFVEENNEIKMMNNDKDYDLYNYAACKTFSNGGDVYPLEKEEMPVEADILAIYRY